MVVDPSFTSSKKIEIQGETFELLGLRALHWPARKMLFISDIHWGKTQHFRQSGLAVPDGVLANDLNRFTQAIAQTCASHVVILGDLVHSQQGVTQNVFEAVLNFRIKNPVMMTLVRGNHDRFAMPTEWNIEIIENDFCPSANFVFTHEPKEIPNRFVWAGHLHPMVWLRGRGDALRLPCFHVGPSLGILPAFSEFTGGVCLQHNRNDQVYAIVEDSIFEVKKSLRSKT